jgi:hypothetical protein
MIDIVLSFLGPVYFGYQHDLYMAMVVWTLFFSVFFMWKSRTSLKLARQAAFGSETVSAVRVGFITVLLFISVVLVFLAMHSAVYFWVARLL